MFRNLLNILNKVEIEMKIKDYKLPVSEAFYSLQGEGRYTGKPAVFLRLGGCNLMCGGQGTQHDKELHNGATWRCDTIEVWMQSQMKHFTDVLSYELLMHIAKGAHLIITGGEPLLYDETVVRYIDYVKKELSSYNTRVFVEIETNGTITPSKELMKRVGVFNCSPKLANSGNDKQRRINKEALLTLNKANTVFKFVLSSKQDYDEMKQDFVNTVGIDKRKIMLMPAGETQDELAISREVVSTICKDEYLQFTDRLHITLWNKKTGV